MPVSLNSFPVTPSFSCHIRHSSTCSSESAQCSSLCQAAHPSPCFLLVLTPPSGHRIKCLFIGEASLSPQASVSSLCPPSPSSRCFLIVLVTTYSCTPSSSVPLWSDVHVFCRPISSMGGGTCQLFTNTCPAPGEE